MKNQIALNVARFNRLRRKPPREILTFLVKRSDQFLMHLRDRIRMIFGEIRLTDKEFLAKFALENPDIVGLGHEIALGDMEGAKGKLASVMRNRVAPSFYFDMREKERIVRTIENDFPKSRKRTIDLAEELVSHKFHLLGNEVSFNGPIDWHFSENNKGRWPLSFSPNIDYFSPKRLGDIKIPWELNRTQHFVVLGKAYLYSGDERYASEFVTQMLSWIRENPYQRGINWMEGIEASLRLLSWVWAYYFFLHSDEFDEKTRFEFLKSVYMQTKFIEEHLSDKWRINNNHLIAEAAALAVIGIVFPEFKDAERWKKVGIELIERELKSQILPDGVTWEHSTGYQKFVADLCFLVSILMLRNGVRIPEVILSKLNLMTDFLSRVAKSDGRIPLVGDEDQGRVLTLDEAAYDDVGSTTTIGSMLLNRKDWLNTQSEQALWLSNARTLAKESHSLAQTSKLFEDSGFMVMRDRDKYLLFVTGPQNSRYLHAGHRHLDMLSILLEAYGTYFLVDPGTYTYYGDFRWRRYFKSLKAHNSVVVDDQDPVNINEAFELSRIPYAQIQDSIITDKFDWIIARHDGYKPINHVRQVFFVKPEYWVIADLLKGEGEHIYDLYFHFNHELKIEFNERDQSVIGRGLTESVKISPLLTAGLDGEILEGQFSLSYGSKVGAPLVRYRKRGEAPQILITVLYPFKNGSMAENLAKKIELSQIAVLGKQEKPYDEIDVTEVKLDFGAFCDYIVLSNVGEQQLYLRGLERKAKVLYFREREDNAT